MSIKKIILYNQIMKNIKAKEQIKAMTALKGITLTKLAELISKKTKENYSVSSLSQKLGRGTIPYNEVMMIADILGFKVSYNLDEK